MRSRRFLLPHWFALASLAPGEIACWDATPPTADADLADARVNADARLSCEELDVAWFLASQEVSASCESEADCVIVGLTSIPDCGCRSLLGCLDARNSVAYEASPAFLLEQEFKLRCSDFINSCDCPPATARCVEQKCVGEPDNGCF